MYLKPDLQNIQTMKKLLFVCLLFTSQIALGQQTTKDQIIRSGAYYYGTGTSHDENDARDQALNEISSMIAVTVASNFEVHTVEEVRQRERDLTETATFIIQTYSTATLRNVQSIRRILPDGRIELFAYIDRQSVQEIYDERKQMIMAMYQEGKRNAASGNLAFAFKNWYFGIILLKSIPGENVVVGNTNLSIELPAAINRTLQNIRFELLGDRQTQGGFRELDMRVSYQNKPVSLLHYRFWDGRNDHGTGQVRDGVSTIRLAGGSAQFDQLRLFPQYSYYSARRENPTVETLWDLVIRPKFDNERHLALQTSERAAKPLLPAIDPPAQLSMHHTDEIEVADAITQNTNRFIRLLEQGDARAAADHYAEDAFLSEKLFDYMRLNNPRPVGIMQDVGINSTRYGFEARKIMVRHHYPTINKQTTEYIVLDFNHNGELIDLNMSITEELYDKFTRQAEYGRDWQQRQEIIKFIEKYRTAFHTRDLETINLMFAEDALILVGRHIETREMNSSELNYIQLPGQPGFAQLRLTKEEYIRRQRQVFDSQRDIFIDFSTFDITSKSNAPDVYGVAMRQHYSSTTYADEGYLFLLIDFEHENPQIYIRAWQPNEWDTNALINAGNFRVYK